ncbi:MAG: ABC transporter ATP-binding protein [Gammaproteobacteria bacterium]|nr:ABC transporter ATP-binding protein [Gammaproteobacteria bacterium]
MSKAYGNKRVCQKISYEFSTGVYAIRGPNGVGKTTLLKILAGVLNADSGTVWIDQYSMQDAPLSARARLAYVPDECPVYPFLTGMEFLRFVAYAKQCELPPELREIIEVFGLTDHLATKFSDMSLGTHKKTMLASAWIGNPSAIILDEPSNALDASARNALVTQLNVARHDRTVLISTHDAEFIAAIGAKVILFDEFARGG